MNQEAMKMMNRKFFANTLLATALLLGSAQAGENLKVNPRLDYGSDSQDGALITGDNMDDGFVAGKPNYVIFYGEG